MGPERPFSVIMAVAAIFIVGGQIWLSPAPHGLEIVIRVAAVLFGGLCFWGAIELWIMGRDR